MSDAIASFTGAHRWLSNFWPCEIMLGGFKYHSVEAAYVAAKTLDEDARAVVRSSPTPGAAKKFGKGLVLRSDWEQIKLALMGDLLRQKFLAGSLLADKLLATGDALLTEGNTWGDTYWGVCRGTGDNHLGVLLMKIRSELQGV